MRYTGRVGAVRAMRVARILSARARARALSSRLGSGTVRTTGAGAGTGAGSGAGVLVHASIASQVSANARVPDRRAERTWVISGKLHERGCPRNAADH
jgi:hypothetical protein